MPTNNLEYPNFGKPQLIQSELEAIASLHKKWVLKEKGGVRADFSNQDLTLCNFEGMNFKGACFMGSELLGVNMRRAVLSGAHFTQATLTDANLDRAILNNTVFINSNLHNVNLYNAQLQGCAGNGKEIKSLSIGGYHCTYTSHVIQFGCKRKSIQEWVDVNDELLEEMDSNNRAIMFHRTHYTTLRNIIVDMSPAVSSRYVNSESE